MKYLGIVVRNVCVGGEEAVIMGAMSEEESGRGGIYFPLSSLLIGM